MPQQAQKRGISDGSDTATRASRRQSNAISLQSSAITTCQVSIIKRKGAITHKWGVHVPFFDH